MTIRDGFFPGSAAGHDLGPIAFAHIDVDVYEATKATLEYVSELIVPRSLIVLDDHRRTARGVDRAVEEFVGERDDWTCLPLFPSEALLLNRSWFG